MRLRHLGILFGALAYLMVASLMPSQSVSPDIPAWFGADICGDAGDENDDAACPFCLLAKAAALPAPIVAPLAPTRQAYIRSAMLRLPVQRTAAWLTPPATGPPLDHV